MKTTTFPVNEQRRSLCDADPQMPEQARRKRPEEVELCADGRLRP